MFSQRHRKAQSLTFSAVFSNRVEEVVDFFFNRAKFSLLYMPLFGRFKVPQTQVPGLQPGPRYGPCSVDVFGERAPSSH